MGQAEGALRLGLGNLFAVAEAYPELKTNETFQHLQARITGLENAIADRREFYNDSVSVNNVRVEQFPDTVIARPFSFRQFPLLSTAHLDIRLKDGIHLIRQPSHGRPFLIANREVTALVRHFRLWSWGHLVLIMAALLGLVFLERTL